MNCKPFVLPLALSAGLTNSAPLASPGMAAESVVIRNLEKPGAFEIENTGGSIELEWQASIERKTGERWEPLPANIKLNLIEQCGTAMKGRCLSLPAGGKIRPVPWTGFACLVQCPRSCRSNSYLGPGTFRVVVSSCDSGQKFRGPEFQLPAPSRPAVKGQPRVRKQRSVGNPSSVR